MIFFNTFFGKLILEDGVNFMKKQYNIELPSHFDWHAILGYLKREPREIMYQVTGDGCVRRAFKYDGQAALIEIEHSENCLKVTILNDLNNASIVQENILPFIKDWFDIGTDLSKFYELASSDEILAPLIKTFNGLRLVGMPDFYEAITWGILGQQINLGYTYTLKKRFTEKFGEELVYEGHSYWIYPRPEVVASATKEELLALRLTQRKTEYLSDISKKISNKMISKDLYQNCLSAKKAEKKMVELRGIGPWTANYVLMRCLRMGDAFPMADIGLLNGIKKIKNLDSKPDNEYMKTLGLRWKSWSSYATFYIWRLLY